MWVNTAGGPLPYTIRRMPRHPIGSVIYNRWHFARVLRETPVEAGMGNMDGTLPSLAPWEAGMGDPEGAGFPAYSIVPSRRKCYTSAASQQIIAKGLHNHPLLQQKMSQPIASLLLGFLLGIIATLIAQRIVRYFRLKDPGRREKLADLQAIRKWMQSYHCLFDVIYPECPELVLAHKMLSQNYPHYDKATPLKLHAALKEYQAYRKRHDELEKVASLSMQALSNRHLDRIYGLNKSISSVFQKMGLLKGSLLFPVSFSADIGEHLKIIDQYKEKVFEEFPHKVIREIEWEKLETVPPAQLSTIVHPRMKYFQTDEDASRYRVKESKLFDEMQNLSFYRIVAKKEIDQILSKIERQEEHYAIK